MNRKCAKENSYMYTLLRSGQIPLSRDKKKRNMLAILSAILSDRLRMTDWHYITGILLK